jgi:hypothetical protein
VFIDGTANRMNERLQAARQEAERNRNARDQRVGHWDGYINALEEAEQALKVIRKVAIGGAG